MSHFIFLGTKLSMGKYEAFICVLGNVLKSPKQGQNQSLNCVSPKRKTPLHTACLMEILLPPPSLWA